MNSIGQTSWLMRPAVSGVAWAGIVASNASPSRAPRSGKAVRKQVTGGVSRRLLLEADDGQVTPRRQAAILHAAVKAYRHEFVDQHHGGWRRAIARTRFPNSQPPSPLFSTCSTSAGSKGRNWLRIAASKASAKMKL
jgi:hypothetical protein